MVEEFQEYISDEHLFEKYQKNGDNDAFNTLYQRYSKKVLAYCIRANRDRELAYDVFQKTWTAVIEKKSSFKGGSFIAWVMIITRNFCLMEKRDHKITEELTEDLAYHNHNDYKSDIKELLINEINNLPNDLREIIKYRYFDEFSYNELAEIFGLTISNVKVRLFRAKKMLSEKMSYLTKELK
jgi:RNA polymerase sigma-70 factor (ECF subfamily)